MTKQSRLEAEGIQAREEQVRRNYYQQSKGDEDITSEYSAQHKNALSDGDVKGKGINNGESMGVLYPNRNASKTQLGSTIDTSAGGGLYDIEGRNGIGGRKRSIIKNLYSAENPYGSDSVSCDEHVKNYNQYIVK